MKKRTTIQLKSENFITYFLSDITEQEKQIIINNKDDLSKATKLLNNEIICERIEKLGETSLIKPTSITPYVEYLKGYAPSKREGRKIQWRDYIQSEAKQLENAWLVAVCEDSSSSARSAIKQMKYKYTVLWTQPIKN